MMMMMTMITMSMTRTVIVINLLHHLQYSGHVQQSQTSHLYRSPPLTNPTKFGFGKTSFSFRPALATFWKETSNDVDVMMSSVSATSKQTNFISNKTQPRKNTSGFTQPVSASKRLILISSNTFLGIKLLSTWTSLRAGLPIWQGKVRPDLDSKKKRSKCETRKNLYLTTKNPIIQSTQSYKIQKITFGKEQKNLRDTLWTAKSAVKVNFRTKEPSPLDPGWQRMDQ